MLLNLSNHPTDKWQPKQLEAAIAQYGSVIDMPFPSIPPTHSKDQVAMLVDSYESKIRRTDATVVHIMGELTFVYAMVNRLESIGIPCIASTTERVVSDTPYGKVSNFEFVRFRSY